MARRPKTAKLAADPRLRDYVQRRLSGEVRRPDGTVAGPLTPAWKGRNKPRRKDRRWATAWSPEQISHRLKVEFPDDESMRISHEAIYQPLFIQSRGALKRELVACLRTGRALRVPRARVGARGKQFVTEEVMISGRPAEAEDRAVPGHRADPEQKAVEYRAVLVPIREAVDVLHDECPRLRASEEPDVFVQEAGLGICARTFVLEPVAALRERRARGSADEQVDLAGEKAAPV
jgi:hypothetical protein